MNKRQEKMKKKTPRFSMTILQNYSKVAHGGTRKP
jgi:hypothetical protein